MFTKKATAKEEDIPNSFHVNDKEHCFILILKESGEMVVRVKGGPDAQIVNYLHEEFKRILLEALSSGAVRDITETEIH